MCDNIHQKEMKFTHVECSRDPVTEIFGEPQPRLCFKSQAIHKKAAME
jgi:hypothetical protein